MTLQAIIDVTVAEKAMTSGGIRQSLVADRTIRQTCLLQSQLLHAGYEPQAPQNFGIDEPKRVDRPAARYRTQHTFPAESASGSEGHKKPVDMGTHFRTAIGVILTTLVALPASAQLTVDQKIHDFHNIAAVYAKRYPP